MKRHQLYSIAALAAALCTPFGMQKTAAAQPTVQSESMGADQFIAKWCGITIRSILPDGSEKQEFSWYTRITPENAEHILEGRRVFDALDNETQQIVIQAAKAHQIDYLAFTDQAAAFVKEQNAPEPVAQPSADTVSSPNSGTENEQVPAASENSTPEKKTENSASSSQEASVQPASDNSEQSSENSSFEKDSKTETKDSSSSDKNSETDDSSSSDKNSDSEAEHSSSAKNTDRSVFSSQDSRNPSDSSVHNQSETNADSSASEKDSSKAPEKSDQDHQTSAQDSSDSDSDSAVSEEKPSEEQEQNNIETDHQQVPAVVQVPALNVPVNPSVVPAGLTSSPADLPIADDAYQSAWQIALQTGMKDWNLLPVIYSYTLDGQAVASQPYYFLQDPSRTVIYQVLSSDGKSAKIQFFTDDSCTFDASSGSLLLCPKSEGTVIFGALQPEGEQSSAQTAEPETAPVSGQDKGSSAAESSEPSEADSSASEQEQQIKDEKTESDENLSESASLLQAQNASGQDAAASAFINRYCYLQGALIRTADQMNYQQILNGLQNWEQMSTASRQAVNSYLTSRGSQSWPALYRQANQVRLGLPVTSIQPSGSYRPSVHTGAAEDFVLWLGTAAGSLETMIYLALKPKKKD